MNRYTYIGRKDLPQHIIANELWRKKTYKNEAVLVLTVKQNDTYSCLGFRKRYGAWIFDMNSSFRDLTGKHIRRYYEIVDLLDV